MFYFIHVFLGHIDILAQSMVSFQYHLTDRDKLAHR